MALATIADVAPLRGENRVLVRYGLRLLADTTHPGLRALMRSSGLDGKPLTGDFGNLRIANQGEGEFSRWVRQVVALEVRIAE
mgnify:CR=1 FL=1